MRSLPARWTSAVAGDPLVVISAGRSMYRVADLLELAKLTREIQRMKTLCPRGGGAAGCKGDYAVGVNLIMSTVLRLVIWNLALKPADT